MFFFYKSRILKNKKNIECVNKILEMKKLSTFDIRKKYVNKELWRLSLFNFKLKMYRWKYESFF